MKKEIQDLSWRCLPSAERKKIRGDYVDNDKVRESDDFCAAICDTYEDIFGHHNLTSDEEPSERLFVERKKAADLYVTMDNAFPREAAYSVQESLKALFGDKCLLDKEPMKIDAADSLIAMAKDEMDINDKEPSVQCEPKFNKGDKVRIVNVANPMMRGEIGIIEELPMKDESRYKVRFEEDHWTLLDAVDLEPYTEPETKDAYEQYREAKANESRNLSQNIANCDKSEDNQLKSNMEEKEIDLAELLEVFKDTDISFYSSLFGESLIREVNSFGIEIAPIGSPTDRVMLWRNGNFGKYGQCVLFPSRALYEKYPLDAPKAWWEWQESRKSKYIFEIEISSWTDGEDGRENENYEGKKWFKFDSAMELKQAAEAVRETLLKIHEKQSKQ